MIKEYCVRLICVPSRRYWTDLIKSKLIWFCSAAMPSSLFFFFSLYAASDRRVSNNDFFSFSHNFAQSFFVEYQLFYGIDCALLSLTFLSKFFMSWFGLCITWYLSQYPKGWNILCTVRFSEVWNNWKEISWIFVEFYLYKLPVTGLLALTYFVWI